MQSYAIFSIPLIRIVVQQILFFWFGLTISIYLSLLMARIINISQHLRIQMSRTAIFLLSFFTYSTVHMMRATYSFNKHTFQKTFQVNDLFLGCVDAFIYITLAIGTFFRYSIVNSKKPVETCLWTAIPTVIGFTTVPVISLISSNGFEDSVPVLNPIVIAFSFGIFGFFQLAFFPATLTIFSNAFNIRNDGKLVGVWSSKSNAGNICGFVMSNLFVATFDIKWEYTMITCSVLLLGISLMLYKFVPNPVFQNEEEMIKTSEFLKFFCKTWANTEFKLYILSFSFFKAILYSYELWTPKFLADNGFKEYSGYVPTLFDVSTLFGSFLMGVVYQKESLQDSKAQQTLLSKYKFFIPALIIIVVCSMYIFMPGSLALYFILGALMGFFLGAIYNSLENNQIMQYTGNDSKKTDMFSTINIAVGCAMVGISQLVIGFVLNLGENSKNKNDGQFISKGGIYFVIAAIAVVAAVLTFFRSWFYDKIQTDQQPTRLSKSLIEESINDSISKERNPEDALSGATNYKVRKI